MGLPLTQFVLLFLNKWMEFFTRAVQRPNNPSSRLALITGKFLRARKVFVHVIQSAAPGKFCTKKAAVRKVLGFCASGVVKWALRTTEKAEDRKVQDNLFCRRCRRRMQYFSSVHFCLLEIFLGIIFDKWENWKLRQAIFFIWSTLAICCSQAQAPVRFLLAWSISTIASIRA